MTDTQFDPYYRWLGIAPEEQPANHYRLLGIRLFESEPDVIIEAADRQMGHLRTRQLGGHAALSQRLLNEISAAKICLLSPQRKAVYDAAIAAKATAVTPLTSGNAPGVRRPEPSTLPPAATPALQTAGTAAWPDVEPIVHVKPAPQARRPASPAVPRGTVPSVPVRSVPASQHLTFGLPEAAGQVFADPVPLAPRRPRRSPGILMLSISAAAALCMIFGVVALWPSREVSVGQGTVETKRHPELAEVQRSAPNASASPLIPAAGVNAGLRPKKLPPPPPEIVFSADESTNTESTTTTDEAETSTSAADGLETRERLVRAETKPPISVPAQEQDARPDSAANAPRRIAHWDFTTGLEDQIGTAHVSLHDGANRDEQGLKFDARTGYAQSELLAQTLTAKTLEAQLILANTGQHGGAPISIESNRDFDAIVFGEWSAGKWTAGSEGFHRTKRLEAKKEVVAHIRLRLVITYASDGTIRVYRNGQLYGRGYASSGPKIFPANQSRVLFGLRLPPPAAEQPLAGTVEQASLYNYALSEAEVRRLAGLAPHSTSEAKSSEPGSVYLADLLAEDVRTWGSLPLDEPQNFNRKPVLDSIFLHPGNNNSSHVTYRIGEKYAILDGAAAIADLDVPETTTPLTFRIVGDGRELWRSQPMRRQTSSQKFRINVRGVNVLELFVDCPGIEHFAHAVWIRPQLSSSRREVSTKRDASQSKRTIASPED